MSHETRFNRHPRTTRLLAPFVASLALLAGCAGKSGADATPRAAQPEVVAQPSPVPPTPRPDQRMLPIEDMVSFFEDTIARFSETRDNVTTSIICVTADTIEPEDIPMGASATSLMTDTLRSSSFIVAPAPEDGSSLTTTSPDGFLLAPHDPLSLSSELASRWAVHLAPQLERYNGGQPHTDSPYRVARLCLVQATQFVDYVKD